IQAVFDLAATSNPRSGASLVGVDVVPEADITAAERSLENFIALGQGLAWPIPNQWPIEAWSVQWYAATRTLKKIQDLAWATINDSEQSKSQDLIDLVAERTKCYRLMGPEIFAGRWFYLLPIDSCRAALFVGRAGAGKSHVLARATETARAEGA